METVTRTASGDGLTDWLCDVAARAGQARPKLMASGRENIRESTAREKGRKRALIFIDPWYGRWLKVGGSGLKWHTYPLAHGQRLSTPKILRRRVPSCHGREEPYHHSFLVARREGPRVYPFARAKRTIFAGYVAGGVCSHEGAGGLG